MGYCDFGWFLGDLIMSNKVELVPGATWRQNGPNMFAIIRVHRALPTHHKTILEKMSKSFESLKTSRVYFCRFSLNISSQLK